MRQAAEFFLMLGILLFAAGVYAAAPEKPPPAKPVKLETPTNVRCSKVGDQVTVTWDKVADAAGYQGMAGADEGQELKRNVTEPPWTFAQSTLTDDPTTPIDVQVRSIHGQARKNDSKPSAEVLCLSATQLPAR